MHGGRYRLGRGIETIIAAIEGALMSGADALRPEHLEIAWGLEEDCPLNVNVFAVDDFWAIELEDEYEIGARMQKARRKKSSSRSNPKSTRGKRTA